MNEAAFDLDGPDLNGRSSIDAYMIEDLVANLLALVAGTRSSAASVLDELRFERLDSGEIRVVLRGGTFRNGERAWSCCFSAPEHSVRAFAEASRDEIKSK